MVTIYVSVSLPRLVVATQHIFDLPATNPFLLKSSRRLSAKKTSASSRRRIQSHLLASAKFVCNADSTSLALDPKSPIQDSALAI